MITAIHLATADETRVSTHLKIARCDGDFAIASMAFCGNYTTQGDEGGKASRVSAKSQLVVTALETGESEVNYTSEITISGRFGKFGAGVMKKMADKMSEKFIIALRTGIDRGNT